MSYTGLLVNAQNGKCLSAPTSNGQQMIVADCNPSDDKQIITLSNNRLSTKARKDNDGMINTWEGNLYWSGESGNGNDIDFRTEAMDVRYPIPNGNFGFWGWGKQGGNRASVNSSNKVTQKVANDGKPAAIWIPYDTVYKKCLEYGIPSDKCEPKALSECYSWENYKNPECQAKVCDDPSGSFLEHVECRNFCLANTGQCNAAIVPYCAAHPDDTKFCGCYNLQAYAKTREVFAKIPESFSAKCNVSDCLAPYAYKTKEIDNEQCNRQICINAINLDVETSTLSNVKFDCNNIQNQGGGGSSGSDEPDTSTPTGFSAWFTTKNIMWMVLLAVVILLFTCSAGGALFAVS